jgi:hypothetical protein
MINSNNADADSFLKLSENETKTNDNTGGFVLPGKAKRDEISKSGTWFEVPGVGTKGKNIMLKIKFVPISEQKKLRKEYHYKTINKKTHQTEWVSDEDKLVEANEKKMIESITDWKNIYNEDGTELKFTKENVEAFLDFAGNIKTTKEDEKGDRITISAFIIECMTESSFHFGEKKN